MSARVVKSKWFAKAARKARLSDRDLRRAIEQVVLGQAEDLGGGVFKKRLGENRYRSIILTKAGRLWIYAYLFAKKDRANIDADELNGFRKLAKAYDDLTDAQIEDLIEAGDFQEIADEP